MQSLYERDFTQWLSEQRDLLAHRKFDELDLGNLLEALEYQVGNPKNELENHLIRLLIHLLKCNYQTTVLKDACNNHFIKKWLNSIDNARYDINRHIAKNPHLKPHTHGALKEAYPHAVNKAIIEMNRFLNPGQQTLTFKSFQEKCPWAFEQIMTEKWYPLNGVDLNE
ncbi:DUF29 domain-containing protein [Endozoicomonas sp. ONNA1]|uniref:DUF29 domain-containing protein n=1 Tax=Endozoicomonas sp. ONNA1 TaxID=2828740 RepID=UPI00214897E7|nr:DUF29 domain-containing protein [Endozoicomonas sp. ONNA1]